MATIKCVDCENEVSDKAASCPKCGCPIENILCAKESKTEMTFGDLFKKWWVLGIVCIVLLRACWSLTEKPEKAIPQAPTPPIATGYSQTESDSFPTPTPKDEEAFIGITQNAQSGSANTQNDLQKGGIKAERDKSICKIIRKHNVKDWVGKVITIGANSDGKGYVEIEIAKDIKLLTWNNELSDTYDHTLLGPESKIFKTASGLIEKQPVVFSGSFFSGEEHECIKEGSLTLTGKLSSPEFIFKFSKIEAL
jgi:hypothetical protein